MGSFYAERVPLRQERNKPYTGKKKAVGINLSPCPHPSFRTEQADFLRPPMPHRHFERSRPTFSSVFAPANASACAERNLSSSSPLPVISNECEKSLFSSGTLADETGLPYQKLIDLYLLDCAKKRKKLTMKVRRFVCLNFISG